MESKNEGLQAARAIAALTVAYFHSYVGVRAFPEAAQHSIPFLKEWGFLGVNFFFAISGYVICLAVAKPSFSPLNFAIKRIFRLYPMYWVAMAIVLLMIVTGKYRAEPVGHFLYSMTLLPQHGAPAYDLSWTLEREMVFYAIAAAVAPFAGIVGLAAVLALLAWAGLMLNNPWSFHIVATTQAGFLAGVLVYLSSSWLPRIGAILPIATGSALLWYTRSHEFAFSVDISMALVLAGVMNLTVPWKRLPFSVTVALGDASYSIYLLHYFVLYLGSWIAVRLSLPDWLCEPWRFLCLAVACGISLLTWRLIERPCIQLGNAVAGCRVITRHFGLSRSTQL